MQPCSDVYLLWLQSGLRLQLNFEAAVWVRMDTLSTLYRVSSYYPLVLLSILVGHGYADEVVTLREEVDVPELLEVQEAFNYCPVGHVRVVSVFKF